MVTMLDCIRRVPSLLDAIIASRETTYNELFNRFSTRAVNELVFVGSGTSYNAAQTARCLAEKASGVRVSVLLPNEFLNARSVRNTRALHVFISQTGTSTLTMEAIRFAKRAGLMTACLSQGADTPCAMQADAFVNIGCGMEEYGMRTIGYSTSVLTLVLLGVMLGIRTGFLSYQNADACIAQAKAASAHIPAVIDAAMRWMDVGRRAMMRASFIAFTGAGALYGVAREGAIKAWETPQIPSAGYELDEGTHGPNFGYTSAHALVVFNDGGRDNDKAMAIARYMKNELKNGHIIGVGAQDEDDLAFTPAGGELSCLEFAAAMQVMVYRLAVDGGRDLTKPDPHTVMNTYFRSHGISGEKKA